MLGLQKISGGLGSKAGGEVSTPQEFSAAVFTSADYVSLQWFALSGRPLTTKQRAALELLIAKFFLRLQK
jgi:hypothetical protein